MKGNGIRLAVPSDVDAMLAIEGAWPTTPKWTREHFLRELRSERSYFCVRLKDDEVAGYGGLWIIPPEAQVTTVAVRPDSAGRGIGRELMEHFHSKALGNGCTCLTLEVSDANAPALRLYHSLGYKIVGRRKKYYNDGSDALLMTYHMQYRPISGQFDESEIG